MVSYARSLCEDVEFSAEDALRSDPEFLYQVYSVAVEVRAYAYIVDVLAYWGCRYSDCVGDGGGAGQCGVPLTIHRHTPPSATTNKTGGRHDAERAGHGRVHHPERVQDPHPGPPRQRQGCVLRAPYVHVKI